jgi:hypothetical protein
VESSGRFLNPIARMQISNGKVHFTSFEKDYMHRPREFMKFSRYEYAVWLSKVSVRKGQRNTDDECDHDIDEGSESSELEAEGRHDLDVDMNEAIDQEDAMDIDFEEKRPLGRGTKRKNKSSFSIDQPHEDFKRRKVDTDDAYNIRLVDVPNWDIFSGGKGFDPTRDACYLKTYRFTKGWQQKGIKSSHALRFRKRPITPRLMGPQLPASN